MWNYSPCLVYPVPFFDAKFSISSHILIALHQKQFLFALHSALSSFLCFFPPLILHRFDLFPVGDPVMWLGVSLNNTWEQGLLGSVVLCAWEQASICHSPGPAKTSWLVPYLEAPGPIEPWIRHFGFQTGRGKVTANPTFFWDSYIHFSLCNPPLRAGSNAWNTASPHTGFPLLTCPMQELDAHQAVLAARRFKRGNICSSRVM